MMITVRKNSIFTFVLCLCSVLGFSSVIWAGITLPRSQNAFSANISSREITWVIDAGHGGEDGGAVAGDGTKESTLNLQIAKSLNDLLLLCGERTVMTRSGEEDIHTQGETIRARKASDIRNRVSLVNETPNAVLLSIHQNSLPSSPVTHGAQVFWNQQEGGEALAGALQNSLNSIINEGNEKLPQKIPETIYLMKHTMVPSILIECGFLSNQKETVLLQDPSYQKRLAFAIGGGCFQALSGEEISE